MASQYGVTVHRGCQSFNYFEDSSSESHVIFRRKQNEIGQNIAKALNSFLRRVNMWTNIVWNIGAESEGSNSSATDSMEISVI